MKKRGTPIELYYWPGIQGRGEFVRLLLEDAGAGYVDVARERKNGLKAMMRFLDGEEPGALPFAPPFVKVGTVVVSQTANILAYLAPRVMLAPGDEALRAEANQIQLTLADFGREIHDTHHPAGLRRGDPRHPPPDRRKPLLRRPKGCGEASRARVREGAHAQIPRLAREGVGAQPEERGAMARRVGCHVRRSVGVPDCRGAALCVSKCAAAPRAQVTASGCASRSRGATSAHGTLPHIEAAPAIQPNGNLPALPRTGCAAPSGPTREGLGTHDRRLTPHM